ncbi:TetR/AcrR family transcriptional regulator [Frigidibacter oleivorans]|uniref:TetR/AcrR family transcriptional regulator n=1 Tax=Frigidibacter oleivorans TaxID=2487129 RepID=UPI000F8D0EFE|nr:TetR/AcrR family transcriptional regulator [Frigidibacter oleivorans]
MSKTYHHGDLPKALIAAASAIVEEAGVEALSVRAVAKRVGVSPGAPFRHFASRDALLAAVAGQAMERLATAVEAGQLKTDADPLEQIRMIGTAYLRWVAEHPTQFAIISQRNLVPLEGTARKQNDAIRDRMMALLTMARSHGHLRHDADPAAVLLSCRALVYGLSRMLIDGHFPEWSPEGDPLDWMQRSLDHFIRDLRPGPGQEAGE